MLSYIKFEFLDNFLDIFGSEITLASLPNRREPRRLVGWRGGAKSKLNKICLAAVQRCRTKAGQVRSFWPPSECPFAGLNFCWCHRPAAAHFNESTWGEMGAWCVGLFANKHASSSSWRAKGKKPTLSGKRHGRQAEINTASLRRAGKDQKDQSFYQDFLAPSSSFSRRSPRFFGVGHNVSLGSVSRGGAQEKCV